MPLFPQKQLVELELTPSIRDTLNELLREWKARAQLSAKKYRGDGNFFSRDLPDAEKASQLLQWQPKRGFLRFWFGSTR
jgi:hypothetical protein